MAVARIMTVTQKKRDRIHTSFDRVKIDYEISEMINEALYQYEKGLPVSLSTIEPKMNTIMSSEQTLINKKRQKTDFTLHFTFQKKKSMIDMWVGYWEINLIAVTTTSSGKFKLFIYFC